MQLSKQELVAVLKARDGLTGEVARVVADFHEKYPAVPFDIVKDAAETATGWGVGFRNEAEKQAAQKKAEDYLMGVEKYVELTRVYASEKGQSAYLNELIGAVRKGKGYHPFSSNFF